MNTLYLCLLAAFGAGVLGFIMAYINHRKDYANTDNGASPFSDDDFISCAASAFFGLWFSGYIGLNAGFGEFTITVKYVGLIAAVAATVFGVVLSRKHGRAKRAAANWFKAIDAAAGPSSDEPKGVTIDVPCLPEVTTAAEVDAINEVNVAPSSTMPDSMFPRARFYYRLAKSSPEGQKGAKATVLIASGAYLRSIQSAVALADLLRKQLADAGIKFIDSGNDGAEIEFGDSEYDKYMMRVLLHIEIEHLCPAEARVALENAGFCED
ncbi:hypothetical protein KA344_17885 [bacterium]|jgi:hypothetical protein|nr:hypothetical protein [bacterium]